MIRNPVTPKGYASLVADLQHLRSVVRLQIVRDIEEARAHGDISENSEYEDAKERQSHCEGRIAELESRIAAAEIIDVTKLKASDKIVFGTTVILEDTTTQARQTWRLVGETETNIEEGAVSFSSPLGKALIGKNLGDEVTVPAPGGKRVYEVIEVHYK